MTIIETASGKVEGHRVGEVQQFLGIPYAAAPVGLGRFRRPVPHPGWSGILDASEHGLASLQPASLSKPVPSGEDCLTLNVYTPECGSATRPTMVWFHGGGFTNGAGWLPEYDGSRLARGYDVVVVTCNYRLGVLGWLFTDHLDDSLGVESNCGLFDQIAVLQWVRDNIANFGGDPGNVTAWGQSAGATSIVAMASMPQARGLLHRAIAQSGAANGLLSVHAAQSVADDFLLRLRELGVSTLQDARPEQLISAQNDVTLRNALTNTVRPATPRLFTFGPVVDDVTIPNDPLENLQLESDSPIPLIVGSNRDEWRVFADALPQVPAEAEILAGLSEWLPDATAFWNAYRSQASSVRDAWIDLQTDRLFRIPAIRLAEAWGNHTSAEVFQYEFRWRPPGSPTGATHSREIPFVFDSFHHPWGRLLGGTSPPTSLVTEFGHAWTTFAQTGRPTPADDAAWPTYGGQRKTMLFDAVSRVEADPDRDRRRIWEGIVEPAD
jgi:para-nitrobenzyl esterase